MATALGVVLLLLLCWMPALIGTDCGDSSRFGGVAIAPLGALVLACFAVAGAAARPPGRDAELLGMLSYMNCPN